MTEKKRTLLQWIADGDLKPYMVLQFGNGKRFVVGDTNNMDGTTDHCMPQAHELKEFVIEHWTLDSNGYDWQKPPMADEKYDDPRNMFGLLSFNGKLQPGTLIATNDGKQHLKGHINPQGGICDFDAAEVPMTDEEVAAHREALFERLVVQVKILDWKTEK